MERKMHKIKMRGFFPGIFVILWLSFWIAGCKTAIKNISPLNDKIIVLDAGHGGTSHTDFYRVGPSGEREEWINLRVAQFYEPCWKIGVQKCL
jgi:hypothetical protein